MKFLNFKLLVFYLFLMCCTNIFSRHLFKHIQTANRKHHIDFIHHTAPHFHGHHHEPKFTIGGELTNIAPSASKIISPRLGIISFYVS